MVKQLVFLAAVFLMAVVLFISGAQAGEFTFYPDQDSWANEANPDANYGSGTYLTVKDRSDLTEAFLRFDDGQLGILDGQQIGSAALYLYQYQQTYSPGDAIAVHSVTQDWNEDAVTWNNKPSYAAEGVNSQVFLEGENMWREFPGLERYVSAWQSGDNFGFALENHADGQKNELYTRFYSSEVTDVQYKPYLKVTTTPEPASMVLFGVGSAVFAAVARKRRKARVP